jgi:hypothetical protein
MGMTRQENDEFLHECLQDSLEVADDWKVKGNAGWELFNTFNAARSALAIAVSQYETAAAGTAFLEERRISLFNRIATLLKALFVDQTASVADSPPAGLSQLILCFHAEALLGNFETAKEIASLCDRNICLEHFQHDALWRDYAKGVACLSSGEVFTPLDRKYTGYDRHWATYIQLISCLTRDDEISTAIAAVDESFRKRNNDSRLIGDSLDGDGEFPVNWDFRKESLLAFSNTKRGVA